MTIGTKFSEVNSQGKLLDFVTDMTPSETPFPVAALVNGSITPRPNPAPPYSVESRESVAPARATQARAPALFRHISGGPHARSSHSAALEKAEARWQLGLQTCVSQPVFYGANHQCVSL